MEEIVLAKRGKLACEAIKAFLEKEHFKVVIEHLHVDNLITISQLKTPDVLIIDDSMFYHDPASLLMFTGKISGSVNTILIMNSYEETFPAAAFEQKIKGILLKEEGLDGLLTCLRIVINGGGYISPYTAGRQAKHYPDLVGNDIAKLLSHRECEILELIKEHKTSREIAALLNLSIRTIQNYRMDMLHKLGLKGKNALVAFAKQINLDND